MPKVTVILRKAYGGAYDAMGSKHLRADMNFSWPQGEIAVVGPEPAVNILYRSRLQESKDPVAERAKLDADYADRFANPVRRRRARLRRRRHRPARHAPEGDPRVRDAADQDGHHAREEAQQPAALAVASVGRDRTRAHGRSTAAIATPSRAALSTRRHGAQIAAKISAGDDERRREGCAGADRQHHEHDRGAADQGDLRVAAGPARRASERLGRHPVCERVERARSQSPC